MAFNRKLSFLVLFFCFTSITIFAIKPKLHTKPIVIDDVVAAGGIRGVVCENVIVSKSQSKTTALVTFLPEKRYIINCIIGNQVVSTFKMTLIDAGLIGVDPVNHNFNYDAVSGNVKLSITNYENSNFIEIRPTNDGVYIVDVSNDRKVRTFEIQALESICKLNPKFDPNFQIIPNPVETELNLSFNSPLDTKMDISVVDMFNNVQYKQANININGNNIFQTFDIGKLKQGTYFINIILKQPDGSIGITKSIKFLKK